MLINTRGIVIRNVKYSDSSVISKMYTRRLGMQTYIIQSIHSPKANIKPSLLQPMTILDLVAYHNKLKDMHRLKEAKASPVLDNLPFDVVKSSVGLFMSELIYKSVKEEELNEPLYDFIEECILYLDSSGTNEPLLPLYFMLGLSVFLGFPPQDNMSEDRNYFDLKEGVFVEKENFALDTIPPPHAQYLASLMNCTLQDINLQSIPKASRQILMDKLITFYGYHLAGFNGLKSLSVLTSTLKA